MVTPLLRSIEDVCIMTGYSKNWISMQIELGRFPRPVRGGGKGSRRWWREADIVAWCDGGNS